MLTSLLVTLARPLTWPLALVSFLVRGGIVVVVSPIVVLPTAAGLAHALGPTVMSVVLGEPTPALVAFMVLAVAGGGVLWLLGAGLLSAAVEVQLVRIVAADEDVVAADRGSRPPDGASVSGGTLDVLAVHLLALVPLAVALAWGSTGLISVTYRELTLPSVTGTPIVVRVVANSAETLIVIIGVWLLSGIVGSVAARAVVLGGRRPVRALWAATAWIIRHPLRAIVLEFVPTIGLVAVLVPSLAAAAACWEALRGAMQTGGSTVVDIGLVLLFIALWLGGLALAAVACAWRAAAWTVGLAGTFGAPSTRRPGDWTASADSGTLTDLRPRGVEPDAR